MRANEHIVAEHKGEIIKENYSLEKKETDNQIIVKARFSASSGKLALYVFLAYYIIDQ